MAIEASLQVMPEHIAAARSEGPHSFVQPDLIYVPHALAIHSFLQGISCGEREGEGKGVKERVNLNT